VCVAACFAPAAWAHKPVVVNGGPVNRETAYEIRDPQVSQVGYHECRENQPELWFTFELAAGETLDLQMGVPKIDRYADLRPAMALLGPGLPEAAAPFDLPPGYGALIFDTAAEEPVVFHEEFTGTTSWQFAMKTVTAETAGRYFLVAYIPPGTDGKLWMAVGTAEQFGLRDIVTLPRVVIGVRTFHEVFPLGGLLTWAYLILLSVLGLLLSLLF
jgi:hypothetical protein